MTMPQATPLAMVITFTWDAVTPFNKIASGKGGIDGARTDVADLTTYSYDTLDRLTQTLNADGGINQKWPSSQ